MAEIRRYPLIRHLRAETSAHVLVYSGGRLKRSGRALCAWFFPLSTSIAEVPIDDQELTFVLHGKSSDFQDATVQGVVSYRIEDPELAAARVDFSLDLVRGRHLKQPLEALAELITELVSELALGWVLERPLAVALAAGQREIRQRLDSGLAADASLNELGVRIVALRVAPLKPAPEIERALEVPARERIQQAADEAGFARRALAVEKERAIQENELSTKIQLSKREEELIRQKGINEQRKVVDANEARRLELAAETERKALAARSQAEVSKLEVAAEAEFSAVRARAKADATMLEAEALGQSLQIDARAQAEATRQRAFAEADGRSATAKAEAEGLHLIEAARVEAERARMDCYRDLPAHVMFGLAAQELASKVHIDHLEITPDNLSHVVQGIARAVMPGKPEAA